MKRIRIAVIGMGVSGCLHAESLKQIKDKAEIAAICDKNEEQVKFNASMYGCDAYTDYHDILKRDDIDAVDICLPHHLHAQVAVEAAEAGKHILVEKPIATTIEDADRMIRSARKHGVKLMVAENHAFVPAHQLVRDLVRKGMVGRIFLAKAYEITGDVPVEPNTWKILPEVKGSLLDMGVHRFFVLRWIVGEVESVFAFAKKLVCELDTENDDTAVVLLKFKNGALGEVDVTCGAVIEPTNRLEIYGTEGTILEDHMWEKPVMYCSNHKGYETDGWIKPEVEHSPFPGYYQLSFRKEMEHFVDCIINDEEPMVTGEDGREALRIALTAYKSLETGKEEKVI
ncbi:MAG: hypothetical protein DRN25_01870 [Thermoplasmata archaeon]|nr:MAG: hypothetical protein DRN25_01870 [Thermoplasmata archaeon]